MAICLRSALIGMLSPTMLKALFELMPKQVVSLLESAMRKRVARSQAACVPATAVFR